LGSGLEITNIYSATFVELTLVEFMEMKLNFYILAMEYLSICMSFLHQNDNLAY
jgi:hypothetical protein